VLNAIGAYARFFVVSILAVTAACVPAASSSVATFTPQPPGPCTTTAPQPFPGGEGAVALVGGNLAYLGPSTWRLNTDEKAAWLWRTNDRTLRLKLRATRTDATVTPRMIDLGPALEVPLAQGSNAPTFMPEWGGGFGYGGYFGLGGPKLPEAGCWRLAVEGGADADAIVVRVVAP
jgi:hypothetical protein